MIKRFLMVALLILLSPNCFADLIRENVIQSKIDSVGVNILNANRIQQRIVFAYNNKDKKKLLSTDKTLTKREVIIYDGLYQYVQSDDELAAMISREIASALKTYSGMFNGRLDTVEVALGSKKFETVADKRAVDFMVNAGYNPLALIVFINKTCPQKRSDLVGRHNLTSKRLARIYEYITYKYPEYLENNTYKDNKYYQNFLLSSTYNRRLLEEKIRTKSTAELKYE